VSLTIKLRGFSLIWDSIIFPIPIIMNTFCNIYINEFEIEYQKIKITYTNIIKKCYAVIEFIEKKLEDLFLRIRKHKFDEISDEIYFFKVIKPTIVAKLIYYKTILKIEIDLPSSKKNKIRAYEKAINNIYRYSKENKTFYTYYRSRATYNDALYFVRSKKKVIFKQDCNCINLDSKLSTSHDYIMAKMIANDMITEYLENRIEELEKNYSTILPNNTVLNWSGSKVDLVELVYSLHHSKAFNNGNSDIKEIAAYFSKMFNIEIEDSIYRSYLDIKSRKIDRTKFLKQLSDTLNHKINEEEK
jgi:hypothetical protein